MTPIVYAVKTHYPHWGKATGFNRLGSFIDPGRIRFYERVVPMGAPKIFRPILARARKKRRRKGITSVYGPNDFRAEIRLFTAGWLKRVDIIHLFDGEHALRHLPHWFARFKSFKRFPKIISMFHQPPDILEVLVDKDTIARTDCVLVVSPCQKEYFRHTLPHTRVELIPLGVDTGYFTPDAAKKNSDQFRCLAGGVWLRDYAALIRTAELLQDHPEFEFHIVAPHLEVSAELKNLVIHCGITDQRFLELYQSCDVLFMPMEAATANNVILEGISCGLPVVSSDLPALRYYMPGEEAVLIKDNRAEAFADVLRALRGDRARLDRMAKQARRRALDLSWHNIAGEYEVLYMSLQVNHGS